jgi:hypothetical protein
MKKLLLLTGFSFAMAVPAFAQGYMDFSYIAGTGIAVAAPSNPSSQQAGWLLGNDYSVEAYMATGTGQTEGSLAPIAASLTSFAGGVTDGVNGSGLWTGPGGAFVNTGLAVGGATIEVRAWYNPGGNTYASYAAAQAAGVNTGKTTVFNITLASSTDPTAPSMDSAGMPAFTVSGSVAPVPEPSTFALAGLGAAALLIFRRRK